MPLIATRGAASAQGFGEFAQAAAPVYIEDVFSTYLYAGTGSSQTITNGIDLSGKGGLVWIKGRSGATNHILNDTARGLGPDSKGNELSTNLDSAAFIPSAAQTASVTSFLSNGFTIGDGGRVNASSATYVSWTFREQAKFFDVVTYTGNGSNRTISHNLGSVPGCIIVKRTDTTADWQVYHRSVGNTKYLVLNSTAAEATSSTRWNNTTPTSTEFSLGTESTVNASGGTYVAYLFAHDAGGFGASGSDNVISCGSLTTDGSGVSTVNLGYEPQWVLLKAYAGTNPASQWIMFDTMRGWTNPANNARLFANLSNAETSGDGQAFPTATGFGSASGGLAASTSYIYIAIRRGPMKTPTSGTSVFNPALGTSASTIPTFVTNFPVDLGFYHSRANTADWYLSSRLQGGGTLNTNTSLAEAAPDANYTFDSNTGWGKNFNSDKASSNFRRAPGFFDVVCYTGTGSARTVTHNLGVAPELMIVKQRSTSNDWQVYSAGIANTEYLVVNSTAAKATGTTRWNSTTPTSSVFTVGTGTTVNASAETYVAYLFATVPNVSKVGSYTGTGTTQQINCGFTGGARFVLIKRTDSTGDWYVWDSARGIVAGDDPYLLLNSTAAEVTNTDYVDTFAAGFEISSTAPAAINANGGTFIFLAIA
jgi:hypothetical protein